MRMIMLNYVVLYMIISLIRSELLPTGDGQHTHNEVMEAFAC